MKSKLQAQSLKIKKNYLRILTSLIWKSTQKTLKAQNPNNKTVFPSLKINLRWKHMKKLKNHQNNKFHKRKSKMRLFLLSQKKLLKKTQREFQKTKKNNKPKMLKKWKNRNKWHKKISNYKINLMRNRYRN